MRIRDMTLTTKALMTALALSTTGAAAESITVSIENTMADDSFFFTPFWVGVHDGSFDTYDNGAFSSLALTNIAEIGNTAPLSDLFSASVPGGAQTTATAVAFDGDAPVFSPGESTIFNLDINDASQNRYFSYASMVVPSNDLFVANGDPTAHMIFDAAGNFTGPTVIEIYGRDVNDNGSEQNSADNDAAFSTNDGQALPEAVAIRSFFTDPTDAGYLESFIGSSTPNGATIGSAFSADDLIARITITPAPGTTAMLAGAGLLALRRRR
jgi:hypothetical protein